MQHCSCGLLEVTAALYASGLKTAQDAAALRVAGITHLINLTRSSSNCAESGADAAQGLRCLRVTMLGLKGEPYPELFRRISVWRSGCTGTTAFGVDSALRLKFFSELIMPVCFVLLRQNFSQREFLKIADPACLAGLCRTSVVAKWR
jgi:hypothetical protein